VNLKGRFTVTCHNCRIDMVKAGLAKNRMQRYKCQQCGKRFTEGRGQLLGSDFRLSDEKITMILHCLLEGNSVRSTARLCDVEPKTVLSILVLAGENCERLQTEKVRNVKISQLQADERFGYSAKSSRDVFAQITIKR
jgi:transposase-like protein